MRPPKDTGSTYHSEVPLRWRDKGCQAGGRTSTKHNVSVRSKVAMRASLLPRGILTRKGLSGKQPPQGWSQDHKGEGTSKRSQYSRDPARIHLIDNRR